MWCRLALCVVLGGCGFHSSLAGDLPLDGGAPGSDAPGPGSDGGPGGKGTDGGQDGGSSGTTDCFQRWFDGAPSLAFSTPQELTALATSADTRDPWISADGLRLYFVRNPSTAHGGADVYLAKRGSTAVDFTAASAVNNLDTMDDDGRVALDGNETLLAMSSNHTMSGKFQILVTTSSDMGQTFSSPPASEQQLVGNVNTDNDYFDPFLTRDGLKLYVAPILAPAPQQIRIATRAAGQNFGPAMPVPVINSGTSIDADPALSLDEHILVFSSTRDPGVGGLGATNLWYATRKNTTDNFSAPQLIPTVNSNQEDGDPVLGADGCELYFSSKRVGGRYQLFHTQMTK